MGKATAASMLPAFSAVLGQAHTYESPSPPRYTFTMMRTRIPMRDGACPPTGAELIG